MSPRAIASLLVVSMSGFGAGCGPNHVTSPARHRAYETGQYAQRDALARRQRGALYSEAVGGWLEDTRAVRVGDFVVVRIDESADAEGGSSTNLTRDSSGQSGMTALMGVVPAIKKAYPDFDPQKLFDYASQSSFKGDGATRRKGQLSGSIAVRVVREMPNGDLFLEGTKVVLINNEEYHLYLSGLARTADIGPDNAVASSRIADAQIEFTGKGDLAEQQRKGWGARVLDALNPF
ncbi:MAG: flagellar basal body L-ring protein FlgH [Polyangiaceae bacterium]